MKGAVLRRGLVGLSTAALGALVASPISAGPVAYFPPAFHQPSTHCSFGGGPRRHLPVISTIEAEWYPRHWSAASEPSLYQLSRAPAAGGARSYRFTWLRSFDPPVFIRVDSQPNGAWRLTAKQLSGRGGYAPGSLNKQVVRLLSRDEQRRLRRALSAVNDLRLAPTVCSYGYDGAQWIFEANDHGDYRYVARRSPEDGPIRALGDVFLALTGWRFENMY